MNYLTQYCTIILLGLLISTQFLTAQFTLTALVANEKNHENNRSFPPDYPFDSGELARNLLVASSSRSQPQSSVMAMIRGTSVLDNDCNQIYDPPADRIAVGFVFDLIEHSTGNIIATVQSDALGEFIFPNLNAGTYTVRMRDEANHVGFSASTKVTLSQTGTELIEFFICTLDFSTHATCIHGSVSAIVTNNYNEKGLAIINDGGFFNGQTTHLFSTTNHPFGPFAGDEHLIAKRWDNVTAGLNPNATINDFVDPIGSGNVVENLHVVQTGIPCSGGRFAGVGTVRNGNNRDVFYSEYSINGVMLSYENLTSTPGTDAESVNDLIKLANNELVWVGTQRVGSSFPSRDELLISNLGSCAGGVTHRAFSFRDLSGVVATTGRSIIELTTPLTRHPDAKYAVTGAMGNKTYLLLLNAAFLPVQHLAYDIDGDSSTNEEGIRIRQQGQSLLIIGNSLQTLPFSGSGDGKIFLLTLGFDRQFGIPDVLVNKVYNIPGGGERIVDVELSFNNDLILTGTSELNDTGVTNLGDPLNQKTFLMGLDSFGNQRFLTQVQLKDGSAPTDIVLSAFFSDINVIGSCWTNETVNNGGIISNVRRFDELFVRATYYGVLEFNGGCSQSLAAVVTQPTSVVNDFIPDPATTATFNIVDGSFFYDDYFMINEACNVGEPNDDVICSDLNVTSTIMETDSFCCFQSDYINNSIAPVYSLCLRTSSSVTIGNITVDPAFTYTLTSANEINIRSATSAALPFGQFLKAINFCANDAGDAFGISYFWKDVNGNIVCEDGEDIEACQPDLCTTDFTWTAECGIIQLDAIPSSTGTGPYTYEWDIGCDDPSMPERTGQSTTWTVNNGGVYDICLKMTDTATGCVATSEQQIFVELGIPVITCPPSITISTDPGLCTATQALVTPTVTDDCTTMFNITCNMSGATTGPAVSPVTLNKGVTQINCFTVDDNNQGTDCGYTITVVDNEAPVINCITPPAVTVPGCEGGAFTVPQDPTVTDNCPMVEWTSTHVLGTLYPCGTSMVTYTATDMAGNQSSCTVPVVVNCECAEVDNPVAECTDVDDQLFFSVNVRDLAIADTGCNITVASPQAGITISNLVTSGTGPNYLVSGLIDMTAPPVPNGITIIVTVECVCFDRSEVTCSIPVNLPVPCCKDINVESQEVCKTGGPVQIPLLGCNTLYDVQQVRWFVADAPCTPTTNFGDAFQVTNGCAPLNLSPQFHNGDVCVFAEVTMGAAAGACTVIRSNVATITLCEPLGCKLDTTQAYCWSGTDITPTLLTLSLDTTECRDSIRWFDPQGNPIPAADDLFSYQPPPLSFTLPNTECSQSYTYRVEVSNECGTQSCSATIRLDNEDAPVGTLSLLAPDVNPLCYGEDAVLEYTPECAGDPERWDWFIRPDAVPTYTPITTNGDRNPKYYSNRLYEDTWVMVEKTNGACPTDEIEIFLDVIDPVAVTSFTAAYDDPCAPSFADLRFGFTPNPATPGSSYTVTWYRNGQVIQINNNVTSGGDAINYNGLPPLFSLAGNYYATVENSLCPGSVRSPVITLDPPMEVYALGPCFRCKSETITLSSLIINPINGFTCTYQWYDNGTQIIGETGPNLTVDPYWSGPFTFEVTCTNGFITCIQSDVYDLRQCGPVDRCMPATAFAEFTERSIYIDRFEDQVEIDAVGLNSNFRLSVNFQDGSGDSVYTVEELPIIYTYQTTVNEDPLVTLIEYDDDGIECNNYTVATANLAAAAIGLKLYPNPNEGHFTLDFNLPQAGDFTIAVFDLTGRKILTEQHWFSTGQQQLPLKASQLPPGTYVLRMVGSGFTAAAKFQRVR